jgi:inhibitor of cysteine peptidase
MADFVFGEKSNGTLVGVSRGSKITIELNENPTTGYKWILTRSDGVFLAPEGDVFLIGDQVGIGAGGVRQFFFRAKGAGPTVIRFVQKRLWESNEQGVGYFSLSFEISKEAPK